jgi:hypothetical protein
VERLQRDVDEDRAAIASSAQPPISTPGSL